MATITNTAEAELSFTQSEILSMVVPKGSTIDLYVHDLLLAKMQAQGYPYNTLKDHATLIQWCGPTHTFWHVYATWTESVRND